MAVVYPFLAASAATCRAWTSSGNASESTPSASASNARACSVADLATVPELGNLSAVVLKAGTNEVLFDRNADVPAATASVMKVLTAAAALQTLGPNYVVETKVYADPANPGTVILVGAGDPTLSALPAGQQSVYANAPKLSTLALKVNEWAAANGQTVTNIVLDSTLFAGGGAASREASEGSVGELSGSS